MARLFHRQQQWQRGQKMKSKMLVALVAVMSATILTSCKPKISGQIVTNLVKPSEDFLVVNGQLYNTNTSNSKLWGSPIELAGVLPTLADNGHPMRYEVVAERIGKDKVVCDFDAITYWFETWTAARQDEFRQTTKAIVIYHYPDPEKLVTGAVISCRCMRVENYIQNGISLEAYDCGVQSTELVPEIKDAIVKAGGVQVLLVDAKVADDFLQKRKVESDQQSARITADIEKCQSELDTNQLEYDEARKIASQSYTNDARYIALIKEDEDNLKIAKTLAKAIDFLDSKYGVPPDMLNQPFVRQYSQEQRTAWQAIREDTRRIQSISQRANRIASEDDNLENKINNERRMQIQASMATLDVAKKKLDEANQNLKSVQSPSFYLSDFSPAALQIAQTDVKGKFVIHNSKAGAKVFAKVKSNETGEVFFWLLNSPQKGERLVLSESTLFTAPANTP